MGSLGLWLANRVGLRTGSLRPSFYVSRAIPESLFPSDQGHRLFFIGLHSGAPDGAREAALQFANQVLEGTFGALTGIFELVLSREEIHEWAFDHQ